MKNEKGRYAIMKKTSMLPVLLELLSCKEERDGTNVVQGLKIQNPGSNEKEREKGLVTHRLRIAVLMAPALSHFPSGVALITVYTGC